MSRVYLDSMIWIYALESNERFGAQAQAVLTSVWKGSHALLASNFLLAEVLVAPRRDNNHKLASRYRLALRSSEVELVPFTQRTAVAFADVRGQFRVKAPDAIHVALAATGSADLFVTVDKRLKMLSVAGIGKFVDLSDALLMI